MNTKPDSSASRGWVMRAFDYYNTGVVAEMKDLRARLASLEAKHDDLAQKALKGGLPWTKGANYAAGDMVQHDGSLWRCVEAHNSGATFSHEHFLLQVKRGRDGRDAR